MPDSGTETPVGDILAEFAKALHDLSQPLTTLQCRLYLGSLEDDPAETIRQALEDCDLLIRHVHSMQSRLAVLKSLNHELPIGNTP